MQSDYDPMCVALVSFTASEAEPLLYMVVTGSGPMEQRPGIFGLGLGGEDLVAQPLAGSKGSSSSFVS